MYVASTCRDGSVYKRPTRRRLAATDEDGSASGGRCRRGILLSPDRRTWTNISHSKAPESHGTQPLATVPARFTPRQGLSIANTHATAHGAMQCKARAEAEGDQGRPHRAAWSARGFGFFLDADGRLYLPCCRPRAPGLSRLSIDLQLESGNTCSPAVVSYGTSSPDTSV